MENLNSTDHTRARYNTARKTHKIYNTTAVYSKAQRIKTLTQLQKYLLMHEFLESVFNLCNLPSMMFAILTTPFNGSEAENHFHQ